MVTPPFLITWRYRSVSSFIHIAKYHIHVSSQQVCHSRCIAFVRDVDHFGVCLLLE
jgi:hypothetical protein